MAVLVKGGGGKPEEEKTVTAGTSVIEVSPSSGKVIKKVTVNPTPTESKSVTPTTSELTVAPSEGKHLSQVVVGAVEDVTPEVTAQTPVITQIAENLGVTITTPSGTNKQILQGNNANLLNIKNNAKKEGLYVWKKLTAQGGDFIDFAVSDNESDYPDGGEQGGYWYEKVVEGIPIPAGITKFAVDKFTFSSDIIMYNYNLAHSLGEVPKFAIAIPSKIAKGSSYNGLIIGSLVKKDSLISGACTYYTGSTIKGSGLTASNPVMDATNVRFHESGIVYVAGVEYTLITMA